MHGLDNRKSNLRTCTHKENQRNIGLNSSNTTGFKGVTLCKSSGKFRARIKIDGKKINLGSYATAEEASAVYSKKAKQIYGEFYHEG
ncbi:hypothetical protein K6W27_07520 [Acetobacter senegalensis]|nr:hypothetical protein [Acetobacter senegalensis]MCG4266974.1 hypothetical protein [Acetobacter senegalensis]